MERMNEENKIGYYAIIPATVLFNGQLKANEKLLYAIITVLSNKEGYCFASNTYLANLLNAKSHTVSNWISNLRKLGFVYLEFIKNEKGELLQRRIYPNDTPYAINRTYPHSINMTYPNSTNMTYGMSQKGQDNNISINKIDRLYNYFIYKDMKIFEDFSKEEIENISNLLNAYEMLYTKETIENMSKESTEKIKNIMYVIALISKDKFEHLIYKVSRNKLIEIYNNCKNREKEYKGTESEIECFINYYYKSIKNEMLRDKGSSFFISKTNNADNESEDEEIEI